MHYYEKFRFFGLLSVASLFKIQFPTNNFLGKFFIEMHRFRLIHQKLNQKGFFGLLFVARLFKIKFPTHNFLGKFFIKMHSTYSPKTKAKRFFSTLFRGTFVQNSNSNKKFLREILSLYLSIY